MTFDPRLKRAYIQIHRAIHDVPKVARVEIDRVTYPIRYSASRLRCIEYDGLQFVEQNPNKSSKFAREAREGKKITWGIVPNYPWLYIDDDIARNFIEAQDDAVEYAEGK